MLTLYESNISVQYEQLVYYEYVLQYDTLNTYKTTLNILDKFC